jgi:signal transduction histidine kinase
MPFLGGVIHQFRNWMVGIIGHSGLALSSHDADQMKECSALAIEISEESSHLLDALSKYNRETIGHPRSGDLAEIGREVRLLTDNRLKERGIDVVDDFESAPLSNADLALMRIRMLDIIGGLIDTSPEAKLIHLRSDIDNGRSFLGFSTNMNVKDPAERLAPVAESSSATECEYHMDVSGEFSFKMFFPDGIQ